MAEWVPGFGCIIGWMSHVCGYKSVWMGPCFVGTSEGTSVHPDGSVSVGI